MSNPASKEQKVANVPNLRFTKSTFDLRSLSDVASYRNRTSFVSKTKFISNENLLPDFSGVVPYSSEESVRGISFKKGDVLIGNIRPYLKKTYSPSFDGCCSADVLVLEPNGIKPSYLYYLISNDSFFDYVMEACKGSKMPRGDKSWILAKEIAVPSLLEQEKVSSFLGLIDARIAIQNKIIGDLTTLRRCFAESFFCEKNPDAKMVVLSKYLKESKEEKCNEPSKDKLLTVRLNFQGVCKNTNVESLKMSGTLYFLRKAGQFIYGKQNLHHGAFGIVPDELDGFCSSGDVPSLDIVGIDPFILLLAIQANCQKWARYATGTGSKRIHEKSLLQISVPIPDVSKHKGLTSFFTSLDEKIRLEESILNKLIDQKKYFLENLFV